MFVAGTRVKTLRSHLSVNDVAVMVAQGAVAAGPDPLPPITEGDVVELERTVSAVGTVGLANKQFTAAESLAGRRIGIRIEGATLVFYDLDTRELLRTRPNPLTFEQIKKLRGLRPPGPPLRAGTEHIRVQRVASDTGVILVAGQKIALGRIHRKQTVTVYVSETHLSIEFADGDTRMIARTTSQAVRSIKGQRPRTAAHHLAEKRRTSVNRSQAQRAFSASFPPPDTRQGGGRTLLASGRVGHGRHRRVVGRCAAR